MDYTALIDSNLEWLSSLQVPSGALTMYPVRQAGDCSKICPYFSEFAGLALLLRPEVYGDCVRRYLDWHISHMNTALTDYNGEDGTVYDYQLTLSADGAYIEEIMIDPATGGPLYDSTDSYAALFLHLLYEYGKATGDAAYILQHRAEVDRSVRAMLCTMDSGLTWAKPDYKVKYLMDNCEVYRGVCSAEKLYALIAQQGSAADAESIGAQEQRRKLLNLKEDLYAAIEEILWNKGDEAYYVGVMEEHKGIPETIDWTIFYPDALAQLFPVVMDILPAGHPRLVYLYEKFNCIFSAEDTSWEDMRGKRLGTHFINGLIPYTAAKMGDFARLGRYLEAFQTRIVDQGYPFPAFNADCAQVALAADILMRS
ncbi:MAG: hypothetical protein ACYCYM_08975 [Saccharofermentanales bacterium]